jgi:hypothetical protein
MKASILSLLLFFTASAQNNWYLSTTGTGNATSWAAKRNWLNFNWSQVQAGDSVYFDGGSDSLIYDSGSGYSFYPEKGGNANGKLIISRGKEAGHKGRPIFMGSNSRNCAIVENNYTEVNGLVFKNGATSGGAVLGIQGTTGVDVFHCEIWHPRTIAVVVEANDTRFMYNKLFTGVVSNSYATDGMWIGGGASSPTDIGGGHYGGLEVAYNYFLMQNGGGSGHIDAMQCTMRWQNDSKINSVTKIHHNFFAAIPSVSSVNADQIYVDDGASGHYLVYDNIFIMENYSGSGSYQNFFGDQQSSGLWVNCYNNTTYNTTTSCIPYKFYDVDSLDFRNNVVYAPNVWAMTAIDCYTETEGTFFSWDYNQYQGSQSDFSYMYEPWEYHPDNCSGTDMFSWSTFKSHFSCDSHSEFGTFLFQGGAPTNPSSYKLNTNSTGVDEGTTISSVTDDYTGTLRPQNLIYDVGAFEYFNGTSNNINVKAKIYLQGPFNTNSMSTNLVQSNLLPNSQPYNSAPWNYSGNENLESGPNSSMVDWVLVELRSPSNPIEVVVRRAAILKNNGHLLETDGSEGVVFNNVDPGSYYIVIYHRDHLAIMSAAPVLLSLNSVLYDFTTAMNKAYGQEPMVELVPGKFGMYAGDGNADGVVNIADREEVWLVQNGTMGYLEGDFNMDSGVTINDANQLWSNSNGKLTYVP